MKLLLDECVTSRLRHDLLGHEVFTVDDAGLKGLKNGALLHAASGKFDVLVTVDQKLSHEQDVSRYDIAVLVLIARSNRHEELKSLIPLALQALSSVRPGNVIQIKV